MIPRVIHYCWFGHGPLPEMAKKCMASWKRWLPGYEIKRWDETNFNVNAIPYTAEAYRLGKYAFVSDYARFWILYHHGGLYFDTDVELIRPIDDIVAAGPFAGREQSRDGRNLQVATGLGLGAEPHMPIYKALLRTYAHLHFTTWSGKNTVNVVGIVSRLLDSAGDIHDTSQVTRCAGINIYPAEYFCPVNYFTGQTELTPRTRSVHHYAATWVAARGPLKARVAKRLRFIAARAAVQWQILFKRRLQA